LGTRYWENFDLEERLARALGRPTRVLNDADVQGFGLIADNGLEMVLTLGTGVGTALFRDGDLMPHLELAQHPIRKGQTYDEYIGNAALHRKGVKKWSRRVHKAIANLRSLVRYDVLPIGGGNAPRLIDRRGMCGLAPTWRVLPVVSGFGTSRLAPRRSSASWVL